MILPILYTFGKGLVPCGGEGEDPCTLCHFFVLIKRVIEFLSIDVAIPLVAIMGFVSAILFVTAHGNPQWITRARQTITAAVIGFIIVLGSWVIVNTIVVIATGNSAGEVFGKPWYKIQCSSGGGTPQLPNQQGLAQGESLDPQEVEMAENMQEAESKGNYEVYGVDSGRNQSVRSSGIKNLDSLLAGIFGWGRSIYRTTPLIYYPEPQHVNYPTNLGVQNARFGSRFNLNFHFDSQRKKCWSSTMGTQMDQKTSFIVATRLNDGSIYRFPPSDQSYPEVATLVEVLPDRQRIYGYHPIKGQPVILTSVATISPFAPFNNLDDSNENFKLSIAPFFYHEIALYNNNYNNNNLNDDEIKGELLVTLDYFRGYEEIDYEKGGKIKIIYFQVPEDKGGRRALAIWDPLNIVSFGYGDGIFDYFKSKGALPCKSASATDFSKCQVGGNVWNAGGFAVNFSFENKNKYGSALLEEEKEKAIVFIYAGYNGGSVMKDEWGNNYKFYYTKLFSGIRQVIKYSINNFDNIIKKSTEFSNNIRGGDGRSLNLNAQWILSQALHSYFANTWLVYNKDNLNDVRYYVSEGDCKFLSTIDVAHETGIFEGEYIPWTLKKQLEEWKNYTRKDNYGTFLKHDMGSDTLIGRGQKYFMFGQEGKMDAEENLNYILISYRYWRKTNDTDFLRNNYQFINLLLDSVLKKDTNGNKIVDAGDDRTTFDCCGPNFPLSVLKENTYLGVKTFSALLAAREMNLAIGNQSKADAYLNIAKALRKTLDNLYYRYTAPYKGSAKNYFVVSQDTSKLGWGATSITIFDGLTYLALHPPTKDGGLFNDFVNKYVKPHGGALLFAWEMSNDSYGYRLISPPDLSHPYNEVCSKESCFTRIWVSKTFNTCSLLKYAKVQDWQIFSDDCYIKSKNLLQNASLGYQDSWVAKTGQEDALKLYPRGVSVLGQKLVR